MRSAQFVSMLTAIVWACRQSTYTHTKVHFTTAFSRWYKLGRKIIKRVWSYIGRFMERRLDCLWIIAAKRRLKCARSFGKSKRMFLGHPAHFKMQSSLMYLFKQVKIQSTTC